mmetsp:Transcript_2099/g.2971  ORF Transcript_2099/g.2971 Transcript_2099/m.2971 type:complete len:102 (-) Transcript_2099:23-328(-)
MHVMSFVVEFRANEWNACQADDDGFSVNNTCFWGSNKTLLKFRRNITIPTMIEVHSQSESNGETNINGMEEDVVVQVERLYCSYWMITVEDPCIFHTHTHK